MKGLQRSRGITPVIATIILSAVVIAVGGAVWSYSQGAATSIANDYINGTLSLMNEVIERFTVEHVSNDTNGQYLYVWVYNYGDVDIVVDVYANATGDHGSTLDTFIATGDIEKITINFGEAHPYFELGDEVAIKAHSRRQSNAFYTYYVR